MADEITPQDRHHADEEFKRQSDGRAGFARSKMPDWAPAALVCAYEKALGSIERLRQDVERERLHGHYPPAYWETLYPGGLVRCLGAVEVEAAMLWRLAHYHPEMRAAWNVVVSHPCDGPLAARFLARGWTTDDIPNYFIEELGRGLRVSERVPTRPAAVRKRSAERVARLATELAQAIEVDDDAKAVSRGYLAQYLGVKHLRYRVTTGQPVYLDMRVLPFLSYRPVPGEVRRSDIEDDEGEELPWDKWPVLARYEWVCDALEDDNLATVLRSYSQRMDEIAFAEPEIKRPNSGLPAARILINYISEFFREWYGAPCDDAVALFVSAALDLSEPLGRDDVRPRVRRSKGA
ncbi:hypothetical protein FVF58_04175 [Paraburkholderia panacisoli]|uniref:Uncharacterized protein n=1 Tax=Paraburkholderia panacisoli TaxID=2603818 RepID=A0A5B0HIL3_9BURK|nr:hypothetical protein [Paraburkholderia panacisoli]KAA1015125.1 hypothetical protein FVF58_04175 [Paraburkholderia panacisoli]